MNENLITALEITIVGIGLVFGAIVLLWGLMSLLVRLTADYTARPAKSALKVDDIELRQRAAIAAVAAALAQEAYTKPHAFPLPPTAIVTAWQAVQRGRLLSQKGPRR